MKFGRKFEFLKKLVYKEKQIEHWQVPSTTTIKQVATNNLY